MAKKTKEIKWNFAIIQDVFGYYSVVKTKLPVKGAIIFDNLDDAIDEAKNRKDSPSNVDEFEDILDNPDEFEETEKCVEKRKMNNKEINRCFINIAKTCTWRHICKDKNKKNKDCKSCPFAFGQENISKMVKDYMR